MHPPIVDTGFVGSCGLVLDIIGAFFLANSFVFKDRHTMARESTSYYDGNPFILRSACYSSVEAQVGLVFLALGFLGQFLAESEVFTSGPAHYWWAILAGGVVLLAIARRGVKRRARRDSQRYVGTQLAPLLEATVTNIGDPKRATQQQLERQAWFYGKALDKDEEQGETTEDFLKRLAKFAREQANQVGRKLEI